jgi:hypothetical protein
MSDSVPAYPVRMKDGALHVELPPGEQQSDYAFLVPSVEERKIFDEGVRFLAVKKNGNGLAKEMDAWVESI